MNIEMLESRRLLAGVTILTHGQSGNITGWIKATADDIQNCLGGTSAASEYVMDVDKSGGDLKVTSFKLEDGNKPLDQTTAGEAIIKLDWSNVSSSNGDVDTQDVASVAADYLLTAHSGVPDFTQLPFHLMGHSRGASLMVALSFDLGQRGIWVDQVTNLDPHPANIDIPIIGTQGDTEMKTYSNVIFSDTYYRKGDDDILDPNGEAVDGSANFNLKNSVQKTHLISAHNGVPAYYDGTVNFKAIDDNDSPIFSSWYDQSSPDKPARDMTGFAFSLIGGLDRPADGVGTLWGGTADRSSVKEKGTQWGNATSVRVVGTTTIGLDQPITLHAIYNDSDSAATVTFFLDRDQNPLNNNTALTLGSQKMDAAADPTGVKMTAVTKGISTGTYFLGVKISDKDGHVRYSYETAPLSLERADFASFKNGIVTVAGTSKADAIDISRDGTGSKSVMHINRNGLVQTLNAPNVVEVDVDSGDGNDKVVGDTNSPALYVFGGDGNDSLVGGTANDTLSGGAGKNTLSGNDGDDRLNGSGGPDQLFGGAGNDRLYGNDGNDTLDGGGNIDRLFGGNGDDSLLGGGSNDKLYGEAGNDTLNGQGQSDINDGGSGTDTAFADSLDSSDTSIEHLV